MKVQRPGEESRGTVIALLPSQKIFVASSHRLGLDQDLCGGLLKATEVKNAFAFKFS